MNNWQAKEVSRRDNWSANLSLGVARPTIDGKVYELIEGDDTSRRHCLGDILWPGEVSLAEEVAKRDWTGLNVVELECGTGLAGIVAAERGGTVTFIDRSQVVIDRLRDNLQKLSIQGEAVCMDWLKFSGHADSIIASTWLRRELTESILRIWTGKGPCLIVNFMWTNYDPFSRPLIAAGVEFSTQELTGKLENGTEYAVQLWTLSINKV